MSILSTKSILRSNKIIHKEVQSLKEEIIKRNDQIQELNRKIESNIKTDETTTQKDWRHVPEPTEDDRYPLAEADITKLLNII